MYKLKNILLKKNLIQFFLNSCHKLNNILYCHKQVNKILFTEKSR